MKSKEEIIEAINFHKNVERNCQEQLNSDEELSENLLNHFYYQNNRSRHKRKALEWALEP